MRAYSLTCRFVVSFLFFFFWGGGVGVGGFSDDS